MFNTEIWHSSFCLCVRARVLVTVCMPVCECARWCMLVCVCARALARVCLCVRVCACMRSLVRLRAHQRLPSCDFVVILFCPRHSVLLCIQMQQ